MFGRFDRMSEVSGVKQSSARGNAVSPLVPSASPPDEPIEDGLEESVSACPLPVASSAVTIPSAVLLNAEDPMEDRAFELMDWWGGDEIFTEIDCYTTSPPNVDISTFDELIEDPLAESLSACPVPVSASPLVTSSAITIKEEPPLSPSAALQNTEDPLEVRAFDRIKWWSGYTLLPKAEYFTEPILHGDMNDLFQTVSEELTDDPLEGLASLQTKRSLVPTWEECIIAGQNNQAAIKVECGGYNSIVDKEVALSQTVVEQLTKTLLAEDCGADPQSKAESFQTRKLLFSGDVSEDDWHKFVASVPPPRSPTTWKVRASTPREKCRFRMQEFLRFGYGYCNHAYTYKLHGYESIVGPVKMSCVATLGHANRTVVITDPIALCSLMAVCDAVGRLPNGVGSLEDIVELLSDSHFFTLSSAQGTTITSEVRRILRFLNWENTPCLCYSAKHNICVYVHRGMSEAEIESLYSQRPIPSEASKAMGWSNMKYVGIGHKTASLMTRDCFPARHPQEHAQPTLSSLGKRMHSSNSGPQSLHSDVNGTEERNYVKKFQVLSNSDGSALVPVPAHCGKESLASASAKGVNSSSDVIPIFSLPKTTHAYGMLPSSSPSPPPPSPPALTVVNTKISSSPALLLSSLSNGVLSSSSKVAEAASVVEQQQPGVKIVIGNMLVKSGSAVQTQPVILCPENSLSSTLVKDLLQSSIAGSSTSYGASRKDLSSGSYRNPLTDFAAANKPSSGLTNIAVEKTCKCAHADGTGGSTKCLICGLFRSALPGAPTSSTAGGSTCPDVVGKDFNRESDRNLLRDFAAVPETSPQVENVTTQCTSVSCPLPAVEYEDFPFPTSMESVLSDSDLTLGLNIVVEDSSVKERTDSDDSIIGETRDITMTDNIRDGALGGAALSLMHEPICMECYNLFLNCHTSSLEGVVKMTNSCEGSTVKVSDCPETSSEVSAEVPCSACDTALLEQVIINLIVKMWVHECKCCQMRFMGESQLNSHVEMCTQCRQGMVFNCLLCICREGSGGNLPWPMLLNMRVTCPACRQAFVTFFNLGVYLSVNQLRCFNVDVKGFACLVCGLEVKEKKSLNANMIEHRELILQAYLSQTFAQMNDPSSTGDKNEVKEYT